MKRIDKLLKVQNENKKSTILPQNAECMEMSLHPIQAVYGNAQSFALRFNPSEQITCAANIEKVLMGEAPKIRELKEVYSIELLQVWIMAQIVDLNNIAGVGGGVFYKNMGVQYKYLWHSDLQKNGHEVGMHIKL